MRTVPALFLVACVAADHVRSPLGLTPLQTAIYRIVDDGDRREVLLFLSSGAFPCELPSRGAIDAAPPGDDALAELAVAGCREGSQHLTLRLSQPTGPDGWVGSYEIPPDPGAARSARALHGTYYGISEAFLVQLDGLVRGYAAVEDLSHDPLGDGGTVQIEPGRADQLRGSFGFPTEGISGTFRAGACPSDRASVLELIEATPPELLCRTLSFQ